MMNYSTRRDVRRVIVLLTLAIIIASSASRSVAASADDKRSAEQLKARNVKSRIEFRGHQFVLHTYLPLNQKSEDDRVVLYLSGASGWHPFDDHIATTMALHGTAVYGLSLHSYLAAFYDGEHPTTAEKVGNDFALLLKEVRRVAGLNETAPVALGGWSLGAGYALVAAADPQIKPQVKGVICIAVSRENESFYSLLDALKSKLNWHTRGPFLDAIPALKQIAPRAVAILQAEGDKSASPQEAQALVQTAGLAQSDPVLISIVKGARNHRFDGGRKNFDTALAQAVDWIDSRS